jgi:hypothetical protein
MMLSTTVLAGILSVHVFFSVAAKLEVTLYELKPYLNHADRSGLLVTPPPPLPLVVVLPTDVVDSVLYDKSESSFPVEESSAGIYLSSTPGAAVCSRSFRVE